VKVDPEVTGRQKVPEDGVGHPLGARPLGVARERAIEVAVVHREIPLLGDERGDVQDWQTDQTAVQVGVVPLVGDGPDHLDAVEFVAVGGRRERETVGPEWGPLMTVTGMRTGSPRYVSVTV
jgi:hypothetical protein